MTTSGASIHRGITQHTHTIYTRALWTRETSRRFEEMDGVYNTANSWNWGLDGLVPRGWLVGEHSYGLDFLTCSFLGLIRNLTSSLFILPSGLATFPPALLVNFSLCLLCKSDNFRITDLLVWLSPWLPAYRGRESSGEIHFPLHVNYIMVPLRGPWRRNQLWFIYICIWILSWICLSDLSEHIVNVFTDRTSVCECFSCCSL